MNRTNISIQIRNTLSFFALFERALSIEESRLFMYQEKKDHEDVESVFDIVALKKIIEEDLAIVPVNETYQVKNSSYSVPRSVQDALQEYLMQKCTRYLTLLRFIPFVRMVAIGNTHAFCAADEESDIDVFIIADQGHVWLVRFLTGIFLHVLGVRRHGKKVAARFCLSFYIDQSVRDFDPIMLSDGDVYMHFWIATLLPIIGEKEYDHFIEANQKTVSDHFPHWSKDARKKFLAPKEVGGKFQHLCERFFLTKIGTFVEQKITSLQKSKMAYIPVSLTSEASVVVTDHMLKFHNKDRRKKYRDEWNALRATL